MSKNKVPKRWLKQAQQHSTFPQPPPLGELNNARCLTATARLPATPVITALQAGTFRCPCIERELLATATDFPNELPSLYMISRQEPHPAENLTLPPAPSILLYATPEKEKRKT